MPFPAKDHLHIPFKTWAMDDPKATEKDFENWKELERWANSLDFGPGDFATYFPGPLTPITGPLLPILVPQDFTKLGIIVKIVGSTTTTVRLDNNGTGIETISIASGVKSATLPVTVSAAEGDILMFRITSAGVDAQGLTARLL